MDNQIISKEIFTQLIERIDPIHIGSVDYLYDVYESAFNGINDISMSGSLNEEIDINSLDLIYYILGEFVYSTKGLDQNGIKQFEQKENIQETMTNVAADKYISSLRRVSLEKLCRYLRILA